VSDTGTAPLAGIRMNMTVEEELAEPFTIIVVGGAVIGIW
jgi:hypothetical protein